MIGGLLAVGGPTWVIAQADAGKVEALVPLADEKEEVGLEREYNFDLTEEQRERVKTFLPVTFQKLTKRRPLHVVALGDSIVDLVGYDEDAQDWTKAYPAQFLRQLARQFFYPGGVTVVKPLKGKPWKEAPVLGADITLRNLGRGGKLSFHAIQGFATYGLDHKPDLVMISFGINDAMLGLDLGVYARELRKVVAAVKEVGGDVMLLGPTLTVENPPEYSLGLTRAYAETMAEVAESEGVFYADLGDLSRLVKLSEDLTEPRQVFNRVVEQYRGFFDHEKVQDYVHARSSLHRELGRNIFLDLIDGAVGRVWGFDEGVVSFDEEQVMTLKVKVSNTSAEELNLMVFPLVTRHWRPADAQPEVKLAAGESRVLSLTYKARAEVKNPQIQCMPSHEPVLRLPLMVRDGTRVKVVGVDARVDPVVMLWNVETLFNQERVFKPGQALMNTTDESIEAEWVASWREQELSGKLEIGGGKTKELPLEFKLPTVDEVEFFEQSDLRVAVKVKNKEHVFVKQVGLAKNFGLKQSVPMVSAVDLRSPAAPALGERSKSVMLRADADANTLFLTFEIRGIDVRDGPAGSFAWFMTLNIDGRSYGKRLMPGVTDAIRISGNAADGPGKVEGLQPWIFGDGYAANFDAKAIKATLSSGSEGLRRLTVSLPRSYLYLHEWALGNGNSQLGINPQLLFWQPLDPEAGAAQAGQYLFQLVKIRHRDEAEGLAVLELASPATARWTVGLQ